MADSSNDNNMALGWKVAMWAVGVIATIAISLGVWQARQTQTALDRVAAVDKRVSIIEASQFTAGDASPIWQRIHDIQKDMTDNARQAPVWFSDFAERFDVRLRAIEQRIATLEGATNTQRRD